MQDTRDDKLRVEQEKNNNHNRNVRMREHEYIWQKNGKTQEDETEGKPGASNKTP